LPLTLFFFRVFDSYPLFHASFPLDLSLSPYITFFGASRLSFAFDCPSLCAFWLLHPLVCSFQDQSARFPSVCLFPSPCPRRFSYTTTPSLLHLPLVFPLCPSKRFLFPDHPQDASTTPLDLSPLPKSASEPSARAPPASPKRVPSAEHSCFSFSEIFLPAFLFSL